MAASRILACTLEPVSQLMAGPAIRCVELAKQLGSEFDVTVFSPRPSDLAPDHFQSDNLKLLAGCTRGELHKYAQNCDILFVQANVLKQFPLLGQLGKHIVVDLYDPYLLAVLAQYANDDASAAASYSLMHQVLERHMIAADFSICASERQRDYWLGRYCAIGKLTPEFYQFDPSFRKIIDVVPFGLPAESPARTGPGMKNTVPGITQEDFVLLWGGGIWDWFDPLTVIHAVHRLSAAYPQLKLYFMGYKSPNPQVPLMDMAVSAKSLAQQLGILDKNVFFSESWTGYAERVNHLLDADAAVSAHFDLPETRFSFRTRLLDYFWAGLPVLTTCGDHLAEMVDKHRAGQALPYKSVDAWESAIEELLKNQDLQKEYRLGSQKIAQQFTWDKVVGPLRDFCRDPHHLPTCKRVRMPSLAQRAHAVYSRGGKDLFVRRSKEIISDLLRF